LARSFESARFESVVVDMGISSVGFGRWMALQRTAPSRNVSAVPPLREVGSA
jgi:hypothetical protein